MAAKSARVSMEKVMRATLADEAAHLLWMYTQARPQPVPPSWKPGQRIDGDCSKGCQYIARWGAGPDPMQMDFGPYGNSQTIWLRAHHAASASDLDIGDMITFGRDGDEHATVVLEKGDDPLLWSFGHQGFAGSPCPDTYRLSQDGRPAQFCLMPMPAYPLTPEEQLRAKTGWFMWVAWKLGEGAWKPYGAANRRVRPDVPLPVPPSWWSRYGKFLRNRHKGNAPGTPAGLMPHE